MGSKTVAVPTSNTTTIQRDPTQDAWLRDTWGSAGTIFHDQAPNMSGAADNYRQAAAAYNNAATSPLLGQATDYYTRAARGDFLSPTNNPYFQGMVDQTIAAARPSVDSAFASSGRLGSGAHAAAFSDAALRASTGLGYQNYQNERGYQDQAVGMLPQMAAMPAGFLQQGGDLNAQAATLQGNVDWQRLANYKNIVGDTIVTGQTGIGLQPMQKANPLLQGIGAASSLMGGIGALFSDVRVKDDIKPVGKLDNGLNVYSYRYKGRPETHIGLLAQEVAQVKPEAVTHMGGGLLGVYYDEATR